MDLLTIITLLVVISALFGYINSKYLRLPATIGLMFMALMFSLVMLVVNIFFPTIFQFAEAVVKQINFSEVLMNVMLSFLLFAGAFHTDMSLLRQNRTTIILFAFVGVLISSFIVGYITFYLLQLLHQPIDLIYCLLFGALISPTDPIAVLGILTKAKVPKKLEINIVGESLFNDGVGVVVFLTILQIIQSNSHEFNLAGTALLLLQEAGGGLLFGIVLGYFMFLLLKSVDDYQTEVIITLAGVMGGYLLANKLHISGPLAMVTSGLFIGSRGQQFAMSKTTQTYVHKFWELVDVLMNAILFVLIGLRLILIKFDLSFLIVGLFLIPITLIARYLSLRLPLIILRKQKEIDRRAALLMTWGGLRGGLSIAMALSLSYSDSKHMIVFITYVIVLFSIMVQGLTVGKLARRLYPQTKASLQ